MNMIGFGGTTKKTVVYSQPNDKRPVKLVDDGYNSWRVVYADE